MRASDTRVVDEVTWFDMMEEVAEEYERTSGLKPINISHWNPSESLRVKLTGFMRDGATNLIDYVYSYELSQKDDVLVKLGFDPARAFLLTTPSGTISLLCAVRLARQTGVSRAVLLAPYYFAVEHQCKLLGLETVKEWMVRHSGRYHLPAELMLEPGRDLLIITNPVYCTGVYWINDADSLRLLHFLNAGGIVIADESLAVCGYEIGRKLGGHPNFIGVYAPHKAISTNAVKFSALVADHRFSDDLYQWADVLYGGLGASNHLGVKHFLSDDYDDAQRYFLRVSSDHFAWLQDVADHYGVQLDHAPVGHFVSCYVTGVDPLCLNSRSMIQRLVRRTGGTLIPGVRNHFDPAWGFSFRVNLAAADNSRFRSTVVRTLRFLTSR